MIFCAVLGIASCKSFISNCETNSRNDGDNERKVGVVCEDGANKYYFMKEAEGKYYFRYDLVKYKNIREDADQRLADFVAILDPNNEEMRQFNEAYPFSKPYLEKKEKVLKANRQIYRVAEVHDFFQKAMKRASAFDMPGGSGYNAKKIAIPEKVLEAFPFTDDKIDAAKKNGTLKQISAFSWTAATPYSRKAKDPLHPDDKNEYVWKAWAGGVEFTAWKIITVQKINDVSPDFVEGYRLTKDGKKELALRAFFPSKGSAVVVVFGKEKDLPLNLPKFIDVMMVSGLKDLALNEDLQKQIFQENPGDDRVVPPRPEIKVEIARTGSADIWDKAPNVDGWKVGFNYKDKSLANFHVWIKYKDTPDIDSDTPHGDMFKYRELEYLTKVWTGAGPDVVEYFHPKPLFAKKAKVFASGKEVTFEYENGERIQGAITSGGGNKFIDDQPYAISYSPDGGTTWYKIQKDADSSVFNKRKETGKPSEPKDEHPGNLMGSGMLIDIDDDEDSYTLRPPQAQPKLRIVPQANDPNQP